MLQICELGQDKGKIHPKPDGVSHLNDLSQVMVIQSNYGSLFPP